jgi:hypothetical protein
VTWVAVAVLAAVAAFGLYWFQPWKLVVDERVDEALTSVPAPSAASSSSPAAGPLVLRQGAFVTHEHDTTGTARVVRTAEGRLRLELVDLDTSNGPDLRVWLSDQPVREGVAGWRVFDDGAWVELGRLKGNRGDQAYAVPAGTDLESLTSVSIWCRRFSVSFGAAALAPA